MARQREFFDGDHYYDGPIRYERNYYDADDQSNDDDDFTDDEYYDERERNREFSPRANAQHPQNGRTHSPYSKPPKKELVVRRNKPNLLDPSRHHIPDDPRHPSTREFNTVLPQPINIPIQRNPLLMQSQYRPIVRPAQIPAPVQPPTQPFASQQPVLPMIQPMPQWIQQQPVQIISRPPVQLIPAQSVQFMPPQPIQTLPPPTIQVASPPSVQLIPSQPIQILSPPTIQVAPPQTYVIQRERELDRVPAVIPPDIPRQNQRATKSITIMAPRAHQAQDPNDREPPADYEQNRPMYVEKFVREHQAKLERAKNQGLTTREVENQRMDNNQRLRNDEQNWNQPVTYRSRNRK